MTLFTFLGVKSHGWTFYDPVNLYKRLQDIWLLGNWPESEISLQLFPVTGLRMTGIVLKRRTRGTNGDA
jgi:hypothetical protein